MKRRNFIKNTLISTAAIPITAKATPILPMPAFIPPVPKTADELYSAINKIFKNVLSTHDNRSVFSLGDGQSLRHKTYMSGSSYFEGGDSVDNYFRTEEEAVSSLWEAMLKIRHGKQERTEEMIQDNIHFTPSSMVFWRTVPSVIVSKNGLIAVRMRASFI